MDRELRVIDEAGTESRIRGTRRPDWDGLGAPCPDCGAETVRHFGAVGGRYGPAQGEDAAVVRRSDYWDARHPLFTQCLGCDLVLYRHPAFDLLYGENVPGAAEGEW